jgi:hypothetical protein
VLNLVIPNGIDSRPPAVNISVIGENESAERSSSLMASVKTCVAEQIGSVTRYGLTRRNLSEIGPSTLTSMKKGRFANIWIIHSVRKSRVTKL